MEAKTIKLIGKAIGTGKSKSLQVINTFCIQGNKIVFNNLDTIVTIKTDISGNGLIDFELFSKTENIETSKASIPASDFPMSIEKGENEIVENINVDVFKKSYSEYFYFASNDEHRAVLQSVGINEKFAVATDGHKAICDKTITSDIPITINHELSKVLDIILKTDTITSAKKISFKNTDQFFLELESENYHVLSRQKQGSNYPQYEKCVPSKEYQTFLHFSENEVKLLHECFKKISKYSNKKTNLVKMYGNTLMVTNRENDVYVKYELPFSVCPIVPYFKAEYVTDYENNTTKSEWVFDRDEQLKIGINSVYFTEILSMINSGCTIGFGNKNNKNQTICAVTIYPENYPEFLIMPLRILEEDEEEKGFEHKLLNLPEIKENKTSKKSEKLSNYYLFTIESLFGITTNKDMPNIIKQISESEFKALQKLGVNMVTEMEIA